MKVSIQRSSPESRKCLLWHKWEIIHDSGYSVYRECTKCERREVKQPSGGYQPVDWDWLLFEKDNISNES